MTPIESLIALVALVGVAWSMPAALSCAFVYWAQKRIWTMVRIIERADSTEVDERYRRGVLRSLATNFALLPLVAMSVARTKHGILTRPVDKLAPDDHPVRKANATGYLLVRIAEYFARPYSIRRLTAAAAAWRILAFDTDREGMVRSFDVALQFKDRYPEPIDIVMRTA